MPRIKKDNKENNNFFSTQLNFGYFTLKDLMQSDNLEHIYIQFHMSDLMNSDKNNGSLVELLDK